MTSIKIKFRPSSIDSQEGTLYFQIIHHRAIRLLNTGYKLKAQEWDADAETIILREGPRSEFLLYIRQRLDWDYARLKNVVKQLEADNIKFSADDVISLYHRQTQEASLTSFMHGIIAQLKQLGQVRTSETYTAALRSFLSFSQGQDGPIDGFCSDLMLRYEAHLKVLGVRPNTTSFYMRILRAVYNRAVESGLTEQRHPFRHVYTGVDKTVKRAIPLQTVKALKGLDLTLSPSLAFARDMFLFSFYTRGMSFIDMAYLRKSDLSHGILTYRRRKTGQPISVQWEPCMADLLAQYPDNPTEYLLPIIREQGDERRQYDNALHLVNHHLKRLSEMLHLARPLSMYVARHSWASAAKANNIPLSVISEGMGHDSEATTQIYLASLETSVVDNANRMLLELL